MITNHEPAVGNPSPALCYCYSRWFFPLTAHEQAARESAEMI